MVHPLWTWKKNKRFFFSIKIHRSSPGDGPESDGNPLINHFTSTESMGRLIDGPFNRFVSFFFQNFSNWRLFCVGQFRLEAMFEGVFSTCCICYSVVKHF